MLVQKTATYKTALASGDKLLELENVLQLKEKLGWSTFI
jgi:hypothetical protein